MSAGAGGDGGLAGAHASAPPGAGASDVAKHSLTEADAKKGAFVRPPTDFHSFVRADGSGEYPAEAGRYHLYVSYACPWAHRTIMVRALKGLEDAIPMTITGWQMPHMDKPEVYNGWLFSPERPDPHGFATLGDLYEHAAPGYKRMYLAEGRRPYISVPVLYDTKTEKIVNNESSEIIVMLASEFNEFAKHPDVELQPPALADKIAEINDLVYGPINDGVYRCGFARSQEAYEEAHDRLFDALDKLEEILSKHRFTTGSQLTLADIRLFATLVRLDPVYFVHFKVCKKRLVDYPNLYGFVCDVYQHPGIAGTMNLGETKEHYFKSHLSINPFGIVPPGPDIDYTVAHGRESL